MRKIYAILVVLAVLLVVAGGVFAIYVYPKVIKPVQEQEEAVKLYDQGEYVLAALRWETLGFADKAKDAWLKAGDESFRAEELAQARTYYLKGGAGSEAYSKLDSAYYQKGVTAYADDQRVEAENCFSCISYGSSYLSLLDPVRISCAMRFLEQKNFEEAEKVFRLCGSSASGQIAEVWLSKGRSCLSEEDLSGASECFTKAMAYASDGGQMLADIDACWLAAGNKARTEGNEDLAARCYSRMSTGTGELDAIEGAYVSASAAFAEGRWFEALAGFEALGDYRDSRDKLELLNRRLRLWYEAGGAGFWAVHRPDSTVVLGGSWGEFTSPDWSDIVDLSVGRIPFAVGLRSDGTVVALGSNSYGNIEVGGWDNVASVSCGNRHTAALLYDGTVVACGDDEYGQVSGVASWTGVREIFAGRGCTIGLLADGTLVACGNNENGMLEFEGLTNVVSVACGYEHTVCLLADGTVRAQGKNDHGQLEVSEWTDVVAVWAGDYHTVALRADGTLLACGENSSGECEVAGYANVLCVGCGEGFTLILLKDGTEIKLGKVS